MDEKLKSIRTRLEDAGIGEQSPDGQKLAELLSLGAESGHFSKLIPGEIDMRQIAGKREEGVPLEYAAGFAVFMDKIFYCTADTLIPRADTALLVETAAAAANGMIGNERKSVDIIEIGTGCGNIAVMLAHLTPGARIFASDISDEAVRVARRNIEAYNLEERIELSCGDMFAPFSKEKPVDIVICNPPYIPSGSLEKLGREILDHEPVLALDAGTYGIDIFRRLIRESLEYLAPGGALAFEFGERQEKIVRRLIEKNGGYGEIEFHDYNGTPRVVSAVSLERG